MRKSLSPSAVGQVKSVWPFFATVWCNFTLTHVDAKSSMRYQGREAGEERTCFEVQEKDGLQGQGEEGVGHPLRASRWSNRDVESGRVAFGTRKPSLFVDCWI